LKIIIKVMCADQVQHLYSLLHSIKQSFFNQNLQKCCVARNVPPVFKNHPQSGRCSGTTLVLSW